VGTGSIEIGVGTLVARNEGIDGAVAPSIDSLKQWIKQTQPNILADETPWVVKGVKEWLWILPILTSLDFMVLILLLLLN
jgi:transposase